MVVSLRLYDNEFHIAGPATSLPTITAETMARHDEKTSAGRAKMLPGDDTGDRLAEVDEQQFKDRLHQCKDMVMY